VTSITLPDGTRPGNLSSNVAGELRRRLRADGAKVGDPLPSIAVLARRHGIAPSTMREVLRQLQATGVVTIRHGSGVFVGPRVNAVMFTDHYGGGLSTDVLRDLLEARLLLEPRLAASAATSRTDQHLHSLRSDLRHVRVLIDGGDSIEGELTRINMAFHWHIAVATGNSVLAEIMQSLVATHEADQREILRIHANTATDLGDHEAILSAIAEGNGEAARNLMQTHLETILGTVSSEYQPTPSPEPGTLWEGQES